MTTRPDDPVTPVVLQWGQPVESEQIAAYETIRRHRVPPDLRELWQRVGTIVWRDGARRLRLLSPVEALDRRGLIAEYTRGWFDRLPEPQAERLRTEVGVVDVIAETTDREPVTLLNDADPRLLPACCSATRQQFRWLSVRQEPVIGRLSRLILGDGHMMVK